MASRRWLLRWMLVLMLWLLLPRLRMVEAGFRKQIFKSAPRGWDSTMVIPDDGVYLVSLIVDPCASCFSTLAVYTQRHWKERYLFTAFSSGVYTHAEAAVGLRRLELLYTKTDGKVESASSFSVVYVAELSSYRVTAMNAKYWSAATPVLYTRLLTPDGWNDLKNPDQKTTFSIRTTGMYWVTARPKPWRKSITLSVRIQSEVLFTVYAEEAKPISASGAFRLTAGTTIWTTTQGGVTYEPHTLLSVVYLAGNKKPNTYPFEHLAFTGAYYGKCETGDQALLQFDHVKTNQGYMYVDGYTEIRRTGSYMVSIRPDPESDPTVTVSLYVNGKSYWVIYAERGVPTGATISVFLQAVSYLEVRCRYATTLSAGNIFSVAFIQP